MPEKDGWKEPTDQIGKQPTEQDELDLSAADRWHLSRGGAGRGTVVALSPNALSRDGLLL